LKLTLWGLFLIHPSGEVRVVRGVMGRALVEVGAVCRKHDLDRYKLLKPHETIFLTGLHFAVQ